jgi:Asp-tRNA(Asn)/Glu-tRNA(Gln) amidotransferase A subunit family amidase
MTQMNHHPYIPAKPALIPYCSRFREFCDGGDSPQAFLERCLEKIDHLNNEIKAFTALNVDGARQAADAATRRFKAGKPLSQIDGMPVGVKDIIETADMPTQMGSPIFADWQPRFDAAAVSALKQAGAVILGKTVTTEFAATVPGLTRNPFDPTRTPGGSSSGSAAAVGIGMLPAALGTQVIGSILRPASYCGCFGFKPTVGALNRGGSLDYMSQSCLGVLAASLADAWAVAYAISSRVGGDPGYPGLYGGEKLKIAYRPERLIRLDTNGFDKLEEETRTIFENTLDRLCSAGVEILSRHDLPEIEQYEAAIAESLTLSRKINTWEFHWPLCSFEDRLPGNLSEVSQARLAAAEEMTLGDYRKWIEVRERTRRLHHNLAGVAGGFITLSATGAAPLGLESTGDPVFNLPASFIGAPAVTLPCLSVGALPLGIQLMGFKDEDETLFSYAQWVQNILLAGY